MIFTKLRHWLFPPKPKRVELRFVPYGEADELLRKGWRLALPEEDNNHVLGMVYLERVEEIK